MSEPDLGQETVDLPDSFVTGYIGTTRNAAEQSLKSLDASINWALTSTLGVMAFVINAVVVKAELLASQRGVLLAVLGIAISMLVHFGIRSAKNYLNIVRFAKLERESVRYMLKAGTTSQQLRQTITTYHLNWKSPLSRRAVLRKVLFEFGFLYLAGFSAFMFSYVARELTVEQFWMWRLVLVATASAVAIEMLIFSRSPYIRHPVPDDETSSVA